ncbi:MAG: 2-oxoglutarate dehydrogenase complex dihydrolipoyllysine-residue succinyltransferase [Chloroflexi bacterium]|nr:2-oxoglutarate dehydrogenase complex dihydrolipoyllysine-residue succinyltransferase [Chloroflexota bacterium]MBP8056101.1 2-oxoglutarate dehydrogenase complex dihydrolipoyllysine-residue succinyltransferase [Chloroflexota bacterium]
MASPIVVPALGESVVEATVGTWHKKVGDKVNIGDVVVELETDKVNVEVGATVTGVILSLDKQTGDDVKIGDVLGQIGLQGEAQPAAATPAPQPAESAPAVMPTATPPATPAPAATPVARRMAEAEGVNLAQVPGSGPGGKVTKQNVAAHLAQKVNPPAAATPLSPPAVPSAPPPSSLTALFTRPEVEREERVKMSRRRRTIARRLVEAQHAAAMLTTFNEIDMSAVMALRQRHQERFSKQEGIKLGFMSFFTKAAVGALKAFPQINAEIDGEEIVFKHYYDIGMAVGAEEGLVVPVIRDADRLSFGQIEKQIKALAEKVRTGTLALADLAGGTFTITNGGIFGSMLSTPILNPPQVGILGLHKIQDRPIALNGQVVIRPMMYVALSYDHRIVDGREAVQFLVRIKELLEDPEQLLLSG